MSRVARNQDESVRHLFEEVSARSKHELRVELADTLAEPQHWNSITLLKSDLSRDETLLTGLLLHECEHRLSYPGGLDKLLAWTHAAWAEGIKDPLNLVSLVSDTLVHRELMKAEPSSYHPYLESVIADREGSGFESSIFTQIFRAIALNTTASMSELASKTYHLVLDSGLEHTIRIRHVAQVLVGESLVETVCQRGWEGRTISETAPSYLVTSDTLDQASRSMVARNVPIGEIGRFLFQAHIYLANSIESPSLVGRLDRFLKDRVGYLRQLSYLRGRSAPRQIRAMRGLLDEFLSNLQADERAGLGGTQLAECEWHLQDVWKSVEGEHMKLTGREVKLLLQTLIRVRLSSAAVRLFLDVSDKLRGTRTIFNPPPSVWNLGNPISELSIPDTYRTYGVLIPGVFAVRKRELVIGKHAVSMAILIDTSGSMALKGKLNYAQEIAFCLIRAAKMKSDAITFIPFSSRIDHSLVRIASKQYDVLDDLVASLEPQGPTSMGPALALALSSAGDIGRQNTFIITDGGIQDYTAIGGIMNDLLSYGKPFFYIIGEKLEKLPQNVQDILRGRIFECDLAKPFSEDTIIEYLRL